MLGCDLIWLMICFGRNLASGPKYPVEPLWMAWEAVETRISRIKLSSLPW